MMKRCKGKIEFEKTMFTKKQGEKWLKEIFADADIKELELEEVNPDG